MKYDEEFNTHISRWLERDLSRLDLTAGAEGNWRRCDIWFGGNETGVMCALQPNTDQQHLTHKDYSFQLQLQFHYYHYYYFHMR